MVVTGSVGAAMGSGSFLLPGEAWVPGHTGLFWAVVRVLALSVISHWMGLEVDCRWGCKWDCKWG